MTTVILLKLCAKNKGMNGVKGIFLCIGNAMML